MNNSNSGNLDNNSSNNKKFWSIYLKLIGVAIADFWGVMILSVIFGALEVEVPDEAKSAVGIFLPILIALFGWIPAMIYSKKNEEQ